MGSHVRVSNRGAGHLQVSAAVKQGREGTGSDTYKIFPAEHITATFCTSMADPMGFGDILPGEWYKVSVSTVYLPALVLRI